MPYTKEKPPQAIKGLPNAAQEIWIAAFNETYNKYDGDENLAYSVAWAAVRNEYEQDSDGNWHKTNEEDLKAANKIPADIRFLASKNDNSGYKWRVQIIGSGIDANKTDYPFEVLKAARGLYEGARVFALSEAQHTANNHPYGKSVRDIVGWISDVADNSKGLEGTFNILKSAQWLRDMIVDAWEKGRKDIVGLSHDVLGKAVMLRNGVRQVEKIVKVVSVDVVYEPSAGGKLLRMAAAIMADSNKEGKMLEKLLAALKLHKPDLYASIEGKVKDGAVTEDEVIGLLASVKTEELDERIKAAVGAVIEERLKKREDKTTEQTGDVGKKVLDETRIVACSIILRDEVMESGLPELSQKRLKKQFEGKIFDVETIRAAIKDEKEYLDKLTGSGAISGSGGVKVTKDDMENRIKMMDDFFEGKVHSFKAAYVHITGDERITGNRKEAVRLKASINSTTFAEIFGDSVTRRMVKEYNVPGLDDWKKIADIVPLSDFRTNKRPRMGGYGDLPTVNQGAAYGELSSPGDEEATYAPSKKGGTEDITIEAIKNDDVGAIRRVPVKLARSAKRTLYKFVFGFLSSNSTIYDAKALFHADHGNIGSVALASESLTARRQAMLKQTQTDSSEVLGIPPKYLIVPVDLDKTGYDLIAVPRNSDFNPTGADFTRTLQMELIVVPYWTDTNNWYLAADKADIPTIEVGFMDGKEEPELFVQDLPNVGSMFNNDKLTYKIKHVYGGAVIDYRGFDGNIVA